jgi:hypothetical protein
MDARLSFDARPRRAPDFFFLWETAAAFVRGLSPDELRMTIQRYAFDYKRGRLGDVVTLGFKLYLFASRFKRAESDVIDMPLAALAPATRFASKDDADFSAHFLPLWNEVSLSLLACPGIAEESTARLFLQALAVLYANDREPTQRPEGGLLPPGGLLKQCLSSLTSADLSVLGVAAYEIVTGREDLIHADHGLAHWRQLAPFYCDLCVSSGLFRLMAGEMHGSLAASAVLSAMCTAVAPRDRVDELRAFMSAISEVIRIDAVPDYALPIAEAAACLLRECSDDIAVDELVRWDAALSCFSRPDSLENRAFASEVQIMREWLCLYVRRRASKAARRR